MEFDRSQCSVAGALAVVGEKWSLLVIREAILGVPRAVLTERLTTLVDEGILRRVPYQPEGERQRHEYRLTEKGLDLYPALVALMQWGDKYVGEPGVVPLELAHRDCGSPVHVELACEAGHRVAGPRAVRPVPIAVQASSAVQASTA